MDLGNGFFIGVPVDGGVEYIPAVIVKQEEALAQPPQSAYSPDPHEIDEQYWPAPEAEMEAGS